MSDYDFRKRLAALSPRDRRIYELAHTAVVNSQRKREEKSQAAMNELIDVLTGVIQIEPLAKGCTHYTKDYGETDGGQKDERSTRKRFTRYRDALRCRAIPLSGV